LFVRPPDEAQMLLERQDQALGQHGDAVFFPFAVADEDGPLGKVNVLDAQAQALHEAQASAVEQPGHQLVSARQVAQDAVNLVFSQDGGQAFGLFGASGVDGAVEVLVEHVAVEKEQGAEGLLLDGQVGEKGFDFGEAHVSGVAFVVKEDVAFDPVHVGLFGADGIVLEAQNVADLIEQFFRRRLHGFFLHEHLDRLRFLFYNGVNEAAADIP
jgi:hypothetical protein